LKYLTKAVVTLFRVSNSHQLILEELLFQPTLKIMIARPTQGLLFKGNFSSGRLFFNGTIQNFNIFKDSGVLEVVGNVIVNADVPIVVPGPADHYLHVGGAVASSSTAVSAPKKAKKAKKKKRKRRKRSKSPVHPHYTLDILGNNGTVYSFRATLPVDQRKRATAYVYLQGTKMPGFEDGVGIAVYMVNNKPLLFKDGEVIVTPAAAAAVEAAVSVGEAAVGNVLNVAARASGSKRKAEALEEEQQEEEEEYSLLLLHLSSSVTKRARKLSPKVIEEMEKNRYLKLEKVPASRRKNALFSALDADVAISPIEDKNVDMLS
jgi:hypothetical protein